MPALSQAFAADRLFRLKKPPLLQFCIFAGRIFRQQPSFRPSACVQILIDRAQAPPTPKHLQRSTAVSTTFHVSLTGLDTPHQLGYTVDRKEGFDSYILLVFSTPFFTRTAQGIENGDPGDCILHTPFFPEHHGNQPGAAEGFRNSWIHFTGEAVPALTQRYDIPCNELIRTSVSDWLNSYLHAIQSEQTFRKPYWEERVNLIMEEIFLSLGRYKQLRDELVSFTPTERELQAKFTEAKIGIHAHYQQAWTVKKMAELVNLSPDRFWVLYQKYFKISPKEDLITKRLEEAKIKLIHSNHSIEQIALDCGFNSLYYFSRIFKKRVGCTPSRYRSNIR
jgi:AraC-like DNA-binding protein